MADSKITDFAALTALAVGDLFVVVDISDTSMAATGTDKKITLADVKTGLALTTVATDTIFDAKGDLAVGTGADTAAKLSVGAFGEVVKADSSTSTGLIYGRPQSLREKYLQPTNAIENFSRATNSFASAGVLSSGIVSLTAIALPANFLVTSISFCSSATAASTPTHWWFSLCNSSYVTLRSTADQLTAAWAANTEKIVNLSSTFTTTYEGLYYLAIMMTASTPVSLLGFSTAPSSVPNAIAPMIAVNGITGQTTAPADATNLATSPTAKSNNFWGYVI